MDISQFDFELPAEAIAQQPLPERDASRLLVLSRASGALEHRQFRDLPDLLDPRDLLVMNRSRVIPARLLGRRAGGGAAEVLLLRKHAPALWDAFVRPGRRLRLGAQIEVEGGLTVHIESDALAPDARRRIRLAADGDPDLLLERIGLVPLPPYVRRAAEPLDRQRYQTVYAREAGSVAAPTAGLHFTPELLERVRSRGIGTAEVVLHVGPGTFRPVTVEDVADHRVASEPYWIPAETAQAVARTRARGGRVVAVGTTSVRALESAVTPEGLVQSQAAETEIVIVPGFGFRVVDALVTNFHLPRSSLLLLVAALAGRDRILGAYRQALAHGYRFYSYGDAMLIL